MVSLTLRLLPLSHSLSTSANVRGKESGKRVRDKVKARCTPRSRYWVVMERKEGACAQYGRRDLLWVWVWVCKV